MAERIIPPTDAPDARRHAKLIEYLSAHRQACLATMRASVRDAATFNAASREEAELAARIRLLRGGLNLKELERAHAARWRGAP